MDYTLIAEKIIAEGKNALLNKFWEKCKECIFDKNKELLNFSWHQHTSYRDAVFTTFIDVVRVNDTYPIDIIWDNEDKAKKLCHLAITEIPAFLSAFELEDLKFMFGDSVSIIISREDIKIQKLVDHE